MDPNAAQLPFDPTPAASVSLACCQSLCDLLKELPLPQPTTNSLSSRLSSNPFNSSSLIGQNFSLIESQLENALEIAKQELNELVFTESVVTSVATQQHIPNQPIVSSVSSMSPIVLQLSLKGVFVNQNIRIDANNWNQLEANSLETIEPSIRTQLEFNDNLKLIDELHNDCNDTNDDDPDVKYFVHSNSSSQDLDDNDVNELSYSSLGERVKSRQRLQQQQQQQQNATPSAVSVVATVATVDNSHSSRRQHEDIVVVSTNSSITNAINNSCSVVESNQRHERQERHERHERTTKVQKTQSKESSNRSHSSSHSSHKTSHSSNSNHNSYHNLQNKDSLVSFELIVNKLMTDCVNDNNDSEDDSNDAHKNDMSFDLRIDLKELNLLMSLSSKLKHSNRMKDLEQKMSTKLSTFLSLLTNKMIVWFSKFKENEEFLNQTTDNNDRECETTSSDDNVFWQLLINASKMALNVMTSKGMSSRVVLFEELLEIVINFLSHNLNSKTHVSSKSSSSPSKKTSNKTSAVLLTTSATKRQVTHWTELLELLSEYLTQNKSLNDSIILMKTRIAMNSLFLNANELQLVSTQLLSQIFREYSKHRSSILEELLQSFHRIPFKYSSNSNSNNSMNNNNNNNSNNNNNNNVLTKLLICLTNSLFLCEKSVKISRELLTKQLTECLAIISSFLSSFIKKCLSQSSSSSDVDLKAIFDNLLNDLLNCLYFPQTISSLLLIQILTKLLINNLNNQNSKSVSLQLRLNSIEFLANISSKFAKLLSQNKQLKDETTKTLNQLLGRQSDDTTTTTTTTGGKCRKSDQKLEILKLLNQFLVSERLFAEKMILSSLWIKEKPIVEIEAKFFTILNTKTSDDSHDIIAEPIDATTAQLFIKCLELNEFATIGRLFDASLSHVTSSLSLTTNTTQRSRAMKSLAQILVNCTLEKSSQLLSRGDLQIAMRNALLDASTSVREATIDLIGRFVLQSKSLELCEKYCELISERILDTGVSVRKRVIKILRDICIEFPEFAKCGEIQLRIIKRVNDEGEGIRRLVLETVRDLWFKSLSETTSPEITSYKVMSLLHVISVMLQTEGTVDSLQTLIEQIVKSEHLVSAEIIVDFVVARVLTAPEPSIGSAATAQRSRTLMSLSAIHLVWIFAQISPKLLSKHCDSLQSLLSLNCDTLVDIHLRNKLIQSLEKILHSVSNPSQQLMCRLEEDLTKQILQSSAHILPNSVKCLSVLIRLHTNNHKLSSDLFHKFKQLLLVNIAPQIPSNSSKPKLLRAIYSLGLFLKHFSKTFDSNSKEVILEKILYLIETNIQTNGTRLQQQMTTTTTDATTPTTMTTTTTTPTTGDDNKDLICHCITSLGFIIESDPKICLKPKVTELYERILQMNENSCSHFDSYCVQVLNNFRNYLSESIETDEELNKSIEWSRESLKQMANEEFDSSSIQSQIIQTYLNLLLDKSLSASAQIRRVACNVIHVIQSGGHVHPLQLVPHLIAMTTDDEQNIRSRADHVLKEIERKFHGFVAMKARAGIQFAIQLCARLKCRGFRLDDSTGDVTSRLATLYHVICTNRQSRRGFIQQLLRNFEINSNHFEDDVSEHQNSSTLSSSESSSLGDNYLGDTSTTDCDKIQLMFEMVLFFPFNVFDEILYILQQLECIQSVNSTHTSHLFTELFHFSTEEELDDKYDDNYDNFARELIEEKAELIMCKTSLLRQIHSALKCVFLVTFLRKLLKEFYLIKDEKILEYSPNEPKVWEKPIHRRQIETSNLNEILLRANPNPNLIRSSDLKIEELLEEFKRFKLVSLTSTDSQLTQQLIQQKLFSIQKKPQIESTLKQSITLISIDANDGIDDSRRRLGSADNSATSAPIDDLNDSERKRLLDSIRKTSCQVSLIDIGIDPKIINKRKTSCVTSREKTHKRKRVRISDSDDTSDDDVVRTTDDDSNDRQSDDSDR